MFTRDDAVISDQRNMWMTHNGRQNDVNVEKLSKCKKTDKKIRTERFRVWYYTFMVFNVCLFFSSVGPSTSKRYMHSFSVVLFYQSKMLPEYFGWNECSNSVSRSRISFKYKKKCFVFVEFSIEMIKSTWFAHSSGQKCILFHKFYC